MPQRPNAPMPQRPNAPMPQCPNPNPNQVHKFWLDMKSSRFIDSQTRMLSFTLPVRANHAKATHPSH
eukprot:scaffold57304_cov43-Phaeocystis_antarctica.AAC.1